MHDRSRRFEPVLAVSLAIGLAVGLLVMHGIDARAVADGHGFTASPSAMVTAAHVAPDAVEAIGERVTSAAASESASMLGQCVAVLAAGGLLLILRFAHHATAGRLRRTRSPGSDDVVRIVGSSGVWAGHLHCLVSPSAFPCADQTTVPSCGNRRHVNRCV